MKRFLLFFLILIPETAWAQLSAFDRAAMATMRLEQESDFLKFDGFLERGGVLGELTVRERLERISFEDLQLLAPQVKAASCSLLTRLVETVLDEKKNELYFLQEDVFIGHAPLNLDAPIHHQGLRGYWRLPETNPDREYLFFDSPRMTYQPNGLKKHDDGVWRKTAARLSFSAAFERAGDTQRSEAFSAFSGERGAFVLGDERESTYFTAPSPREPIKRYAENTESPVVFNNVFFVRNEHRIFCLNAKGEELWSLGSPGERGYEFFQTFRPYHQNTYDRQLVLSGTLLVGRIGNNLIVVDVKNVFSPRILWDHPLGDYGLFTAPVFAGGNIVVGLVNTRGEMWLCGFGLQDGKMMWSVSIAITSFISPASSLAVVRGDSIVLGTNRGVLIAADARKGVLFWVRPYEAKKYELFSFFKKDYWAWLFSDDRFIDYDTESLELNPDGTLWYKPRESDFIYNIDPGSGTLKDSLKLDRRKYYFLRVFSNRLVLLQKEAPYGLLVIDKDSGKILQTISLESGDLKGVQYLTEQAMVFKLGERVVLLEGEGNINIKEISQSGDGWLVGVKHPYLFRAHKDRLLWEYDRNYAKTPPTQDNPLLDRIQRTLENSDRDVAFQEIESLTLEMSRQALPVHRLFPVLEQYRHKLVDEKFRGFLTTLSEHSGSAVVLYKGVHAKLRNILSCWFIERGLGEKASAPVEKTRNVSASKKNWVLNGKEIQLIPLTVLDEKTPPDFFIGVSYGQLMCVHEDGRILWTSKLLVHPWQMATVVAYGKDKGIGRMFMPDFQAYFYKNIIVFNDRVNVLAVNAEDGSFLWSISNPTDDNFVGEKLLTLEPKAKAFSKSGQDLLFSNAMVSRNFLQHIMVSVYFEDHKLFVVHRDKVYRIDPLTGYCEKEVTLKGEGVVHGRFMGGLLYLFSAGIDHIQVFDRDLKPVGDFPLDFVEEKNQYPDVYFISEGCLLLDNGISVYMIDIKTGKLLYRSAAPSDRRHSWVVQGGAILLIVPFEEIRRYEWDGALLNEKWRRKIEKDSTLDTGRIQARSQQFFLMGDVLVVPCQKQGIMGVMVVKISSGEIVWEGALKNVEGEFSFLSPPVGSSRDVQFIIGMMDKSDNRGSKMSRPLTAYVVRLDLVKKRIKSILSQPSIYVDSRRVDQESRLIETGSSYIYSFWGLFLSCIRK